MSAADRRQFLLEALRAGTATAALGTLAEPSVAPATAAVRSPNEKLNIGCIGVAFQGEFNLNGVSKENIVALCDIDSQRLAKTAARFPKAKQYVDYRQLLEQGDLDAVVVSTPDHSHAIPAVTALKRGLDVYCEKPLAHTVFEAREIRRWADEKKAVTQIGTQIHAGDNYRRAVEIVRAGQLGPVRRVLIWVDAPTKPGVRVKSAQPPAHVNYDLWIGPAPMRPYHPSHFHYNWRYWWDFGGGVLEDMACHYIDLPFWALGVREPETVVAKGEKTYQGDNDVPNNMQVNYTFAAKDHTPAVEIVWYHGSWRPPGAEVYAKNSAVLFEGDRGRLLVDYQTHKLFLNDGKKAESPPPSIPRSVGHHQEWIDACKSRGTTSCHFDYSGPLSETALLGNVSYRLGGKKLTWDAENMRAVGLPEADQFIRPVYRKGWTL